MFGGELPGSVIERVIWLGLRPVWRCPRPIGASFGATGGYTRHLWHGCFLARSPGLGGSPDSGLTTNERNAPAVSNATGRCQNVRREQTLIKFSGVQPNSFRTG